MVKSQVPSQGRYCSEVAVTLRTEMCGWSELHLEGSSLAADPLDGLSKNLSEMGEVRLGITAKYVICSNCLQSML